MKFDLKSLATETRYSLSPFVFSIWKLGARCWSLGESGFSFQSPFKLLDGRTAGGRFDTLEKAENALVEVIKYIHEPLTKSEIMGHFSTKWIKKEEQSAELFRFREALLKGKWSVAAKIYNREFSGWTKEAIPNKVHFQICINLKDEDAI